MLYVMAVTVLYLTLETFRTQSLRIHRRRFVPLLMCVPLLGYYYWIFKVHLVFKVVESAWQICSRSLATVRWLWHNVVISCGIDSRSWVALNSSI